MPLVYSKNGKFFSRKENIGLVTDDICSLPEKIIGEHRIEVVKTKLFFSEWEKFPEKIYIR